MGRMIIQRVVLNGSADDLYQGNCKKKGSAKYGGGNGAHYRPLCATQPEQIDKPSVPCQTAQYGHKMAQDALG